MTIADAGEPVKTAGFGGVFCDAARMDRARPRATRPSPGGGDFDNPRDSHSDSAVPSTKCPNCGVRIKIRNASVGFRTCESCGAKFAYQKPKSGCAGCLGCLGAIVLVAAVV